VSIVPSLPGLAESVTKQLRIRAVPLSLLVDERCRVVSASDPELIGQCIAVFGTVLPAHGSSVFLDEGRVARFFRVDGELGLLLVVVEPAKRRQLSRERLIAAGLTPRESDVALVLVTGAGDAAIALRLHVGEATVRTHLRSRCRKLGARARAAAIARLLY